MALTKKALVILGPTATGKSALAVFLAKKFHGEIISADSRQVYKGMNIGTGKITKKEMEGIPHHLLSIVSPKKTYNVEQFKKDAEKAMEEIWSKNKLPIICGGTGFYIQAVTHGIHLPKVPPNKALRATLFKKTPVELVSMLEKLDSKRAKNIDPNNKVRLVRAIEIAQTLGYVPEVKKVESAYEFLQIGISVPKEKLKKNIEKRLLLRLKKGMVREVKDLHAEGVSWKRLLSLGLEYRYVTLFLRAKLTRDYMVEKLKGEIWHYAKRQMTWFKRDERIRWFGPKEIRKIQKFCVSFLSK